MFHVRYRSAGLEKEFDIKFKKLSKGRKKKRRRNNKSNDQNPKIEQTASKQITPEQLKLEQAGVEQALQKAISNGKLNAKGVGVSQSFNKEYSGVFDPSHSESFLGKVSPKYLEKHSEDRIKSDMLNYAKKHEVGLRTEKARNGRTMNAAEAEKFATEQPAISRAILEEDLRLLEESKARAKGGSSGGSSSSSAQNPSGENMVDFSSPELSTSIFEKNAEKYAANKYLGQANGIEAMINQKKGINEGVIDASKKFFKTDDMGEIDQLLRNPQKRAEIYQQGMQSRAEKLTMSDHLMGNKVPHIAGGALGTAGLVSMMSSTKGQQSNAQLYGQQQPYY